MAQVLGGGVLLTAARAGAQTPTPPPAPVQPAPPPSPGPTLPSPPGVDSDTGPNSDAQGGGRRRPSVERFRPCRSDRDAGARSDPRCKR